jgi:hypothetical protein
VRALGGLDTAVGGGWGLAGSALIGALSRRPSRPRLLRPDCRLLREPRRMLHPGKQQPISAKTD